MDKGFENMALNLTGQGGTSTDDKRRRLFVEGRDYWYQYVKINGYAFRATGQGLRELSRNLDLNVPYLRKCINIFLES